MTDITRESSRQIIEAGSKSFATAARLFKREIRDDVYLLYAWCRHCDDVIDGQKLGFDAELLAADDQQDRLRRITEQTRKALNGEPVDSAPFTGLQFVVQRHEIPTNYPMELLEGFVMDVEGYRYDTLEDTLLYCYHVAGVVGIMMAYIMGVRKQDVLLRAADLGIAFQLTNIARDVMDDAKVNRVYLPNSWLRQVGVSPQKIDARENRNAVFRVVKRLLNEAERFYESAREGIRELPLSCAWAISAADGVYHNIGDMVIARGANAWDERAGTSRYRKLYWLMRGGVTALSEAGMHRGQAMGPRSPDLWSKSGFC